MIKATVTGLDDLRRALDQVKVSMRRRAVRNALSAAAAVIRDDAKSRAPILQLRNQRKVPYRKPGTVKNAIGIVRHNPLDTPGAVRVSVMVRPAKPEYRGAKSRHDPFYAVFLEYGTKFMTARPFMRPAAARIGAALNVFSAKLAEEVSKFNSRK